MIICSPQYNIFGNSNQGGAVFERELMKHMAQQGLELYVLLPLLSHDIPISNINIIPINTRRTYRFSSTVSFTYAIISLWRRQRFDLLRAFTQRAVLASCQIAHRFIKVPVVTHIHHIDRVEKFAGIPTRRWLQGVSAITTVSKFSAGQIAQYYEIDDRLIHPVYNGVDGQKYRPQNAQNFRDRFGLNGKFVLGFLGHLIERKNVPFLFSILRRLMQEYDNIVLFVVGGGQEESNLKCQANKLGISEAVIFTGLLKEHEKIDALNAMDVFLFPSKLEGFGFAPAEAMLCEKPVIVSNRGALPEIVPQGKAGWVLPIEKLDPWYEAVKMLIEDSNLRVKFGKEGRKHVIQNFTWKEAARKTKEIYEEVIKRYGRSI